MTFTRLAIYLIHKIFLSDFFLLVKSDYKLLFHVIFIIIHFSVILVFKESYKHNIYVSECFSYKIVLGNHFTLNIKGLKILVYLMSYYYEYSVYMYNFFM